MSTKRKRRAVAGHIGRPPIAFRPDALDIVTREAFNGMSDKDIALIIGCGISSLKRSFGPILTKGRAMRRSALARIQWSGASTGNAALAIFLGKQAIAAGGLGQSDVPITVKPDFRKMSDEELDAYQKGKVKRLTIARAG